LSGCGEKLDEIQMVFVETVLSIRVRISPQNQLGRDIYIASFVTGAACRLEVNDRAGVDNDNKRLTRG
jgi:hypothetical protein